MAQMTTNLYKIIAKRFDKALTSIAGADPQFLGALEEVVDITTSNTDGAVGLELALLNNVNKAYTGNSTVETSHAHLLDAVRSVNRYVITNATGTAVVDHLSDFVRTIDWEVATGTWDIGDLKCTPYYWCQLSEEAGYDTNAWDCCSLT